MTTADWGSRKSLKKNKRIHWKFLTYLDLSKKNHPPNPERQADAARLLTTAMIHQVIFSGCTGGSGVTWGGKTKERFTHPKKGNMSPNKGL